MVKDKRQTVAVAMSGGVDSSVAAAILKQEGYKVIGLTMHLWDYDGVGGNVFNDTSCCSIETANDARTVCEKMGIPHYVIDVREQFETHVISNFTEEYYNGRTPNPCILCNSEIKWKVLLAKADQLGCDFFSTGHYARVQFDETNHRYQLLRGIDHDKDQAYALWRLKQNQLRRTIFPLGGLTKKEVRKIAGKFNLKTEHKRESQEICFIPDNDYPRFLKEKSPALVDEIGQGEIVNQQGEVLGYHKGYPYFTIGQRKGLGIAVGKPIYVTRIDSETNQIIVGEKQDLKSKGLLATDANWISIKRLVSPIKVKAKIRYNDSGQNATIYPYEDKKVKVVFDTYHQAVTPGQSVVFFQGDVVVGGAIIEQELEINR